MHCYPPLRPHQQEVLSLIKERKNVFALLPTGSGKSLCYEIPAAQWNWRVLVVSPLVALMEDQYSAMRDRGVAVARVHSALEAKEKRRELQLVESGAAKLVFLSPERLLLWQQNGLLQKLSFSLVALDELQCAVDWVEFRPAYGAVGKVVKKLGENATVLGLSASLAPMEAKRLFLRWGISVENVLRPLGREELSQFVIPCETEGERYLLLSALLRGLHSPRTALIYCASRERTEILRDFLRATGIDAVAFHAGLPESERMQRIADFRAGRLRVICASTAFGMGVDYPHVDRVILYGLPYDWNSYWQAIGRAGRDGKQSLGALLWCRSDALLLRTMSPWQWQRARALWAAFLDESCRKVSLAAHFGLKQAACGACDVCWRETEFPLPNYFPDAGLWLRRKLWWLESRADTLAWLDEFFPARRKNLDVVSTRDSVYS